MKKFIVLTCLVLNGCFYQTVSQWDIERAVKFCGKLENVVSILSSFEGTERATCKPDNNLGVI